MQPAKARPDGAVVGYAKPVSYLAAVSSVGFLVAALAWWRPGGGLAGVLLLAATAWGVSAFVVELALGRPPMPAPSPAGHAPFTTIVRIGREPDDIARAAVVLAARAGPTRVATTVARWAADLEPFGVPVHVGGTVEEAIRDAVQPVATTATLIVSASAFPDARACAAAASLLTDRVGWVVGRAESFNDDRFAPHERERLAAVRRARARARGLDTWEPDATLVRTDLLRTVPFEPGRPWGRWLRSHAARGWRGVAVDAAVSRRSAPSEAGAHWQAEAARQSGVVAGLADATTTGPLHGRAIAAGALLRELYVYPFLMWVLALILIGRSGEFPFRCAPATFLLLAAVTGGMRSLATHAEHGADLRPLRTAVAATYAAPGSLLALGSALTRRVRTRRLTLPDQPLLWAATILTLVTTVPLVDRAANADRGVDAAVVVALANLIVVWILAVRAIGRRAWERATYRLPVHMHVTVDGAPGVALDASPAGIAVTGPYTAFERGDEVELDIAAFGETIGTRAVVAGRRSSGAETALGLSLLLAPADRAPWIEALFRSATTAPEGETAAGTDRLARIARKVRATRTTGRAPARMVVAAVAVVSVGMVGILGLVLLGYRPMVVRGESMVPTLAVGDVVVVDWVPAREIRVGDIVAFDEPALYDETVTHRVRAVTVDAGSVWFETRGDAGRESERWSVPDDAFVGRSVWHVPAVGRLVVPFGRAPVRVAVVLAGVAVGAAGVLSARGRRPGRGGGSGTRGSRAPDRRGTGSVRA